MTSDSVKKQKNDPTHVFFKAFIGLQLFPGQVLAQARLQNSWMKSCD